MHFPPKFLRFLQKKFPPPIFFMVHLLHRLYGVDAPAWNVGGVLVLCAGPAAVALLRVG